MAYTSRSSFVPQAGQAPSAIPMQIRKKRPIRVFSLLGTIMLTASLVAAVGVHFYKKMRTDELASLKVELSKLNATKTQEQMEEVRLYDMKLQKADFLLDNHISVIRIFEELEQNTKQTVQFDTFEFSYDPGFQALITLGGSTDEFSSVALQKMEYLKDTLFSEFSVSDITSGANDVTVAAKDGTPKTPEPADTETTQDVKFTVTARYESDALAYTGERAVRMSDSEEAVTATSSDDVDETLIPTP